MSNYIQLENKNDKNLQKVVSFNIEFEENNIITFSDNSKYDIKKKLPLNINNLELLFNNNNINNNIQSNYNENEFNLKQNIPLSNNNVFIIPYKNKDDMNKNIEKDA